MQLQEQDVGQLEKIRINKMPRGKGTYGTKRGRPPKKKKKKSPPIKRKKKKGY